VATIEIKVPDIGGFKDVPVIEVLVKPGDSVKKEDPLITLESDKATMEVPAPQAGVVKELRIKTGDKVSQGSLILMLEAGDGAGAPAAKAPAVPAAAPAAPAAKAPAVAIGQQPALADTCRGQGKRTAHCRSRRVPLPALPSVPQARKAQAAMSKD